MPELQNALEKKGWFLTPEAIKDCSNDNRNVSADSVIKTALDLDIRGMCKKILPDGVGRSTSNKVPYPLVLQVIKITNIAAPSANQESQTAPPLLRMHLSDGHSICTALDISSIQGLSLKTFPGTKICLKAEVQARNGMLLLTNENAKLLGGNVEKLIRKGKAGQALIKTSSDGGSSGPPAFIPFQEYIKNNPNMAKQETTKVNSSNSSKNFKQQQGNNHNRTEKSYNKDARSGYSKNDSSQNWRDRSDQATHRSQGANSQDSSRSVEDTRKRNEPARGAGPPRGNARSGKMALWNALDKHLNLKDNDRQVETRQQDTFDDGYANDHDDSRHRGGPTQRRGHRGRGFDPNFASRQLPRQTYQQPHHDSRAPYDDQEYRYYNNRGTGYGSHQQPHDGRAPYDDQEHRYYNDRGTGFGSHQQPHDSRASYDDQGHGYYNNRGTGFGSHQQPRDSRAPYDDQGHGYYNNRGTGFGSHQQPHDRRASYDDQGHGYYNNRGTGFGSHQQPHDSRASYDDQGHGYYNNRGTGSGNHPPRSRGRGRSNFRQNRT